MMDTSLVPDRDETVRHFQLAVLAFEDGAH